jgi:hypothetical protein
MMSCNMLVSLRKLTCSLWLGNLYHAVVDLSELETSSPSHCLPASVACTGQIVDSLREELSRVFFPFRRLTFYNRSVQNLFCT